MPAESHLTILGAGPLMEQLHNLVVELGCQSRVNFTGFVENPWPYFAGADAFLLASKWEGMPNVLLEAGAAGIPIVSTRVEGAEEIITSGECGVLVGISQQDELANSISDCLNAPQSAQLRASRLQGVIREQFTWYSVVESYSRLYASLLA